MLIESSVDSVIHPLNNWGQNFVQSSSQLIAVLFKSSMFLFRLLVFCWATKQKWTSRIIKGIRHFTCAVLQDIWIPLLSCWGYSNMTVCYCPYYHVLTLDRVVKWPHSSSDPGRRVSQPAKINDFLLCLLRHLQSRKKILVEISWCGPCCAYFSFSGFNPEVRSFL